MSRLEELLTLQRERSLTEQEVCALIRLSRPTSPSRSAEGQRAWRARHRDRINAAIRERYANDPEFRAQRLAYSKNRPTHDPEYRARRNAQALVRYHRKKAQQCFPA